MTLCNYASNYKKMNKVTDEICPSCGQKTLFKTIYGWWKCRHCFYSGKKTKEEDKEND